MSSPPLVTPGGGVCGSGGRGVRFAAEELLKKKKTKSTFNVSTNRFLSGTKISDQIVPPPPSPLQKIKSYPEMKAQERLRKRDKEKRDERILSS